MTGHRTLLIAAAFGTCLTGAGVGAPAAHAEEGRSCAAYFQTLFGSHARQPGSPTLLVEGTRVTARGEGGFASFAMAPAFEAEDGVASASAKTNAAFELGYYRPDSAYVGQFVDVFPERGNGDADLSTLTLKAGGEASITLNRWGDSDVPLESLTCYSGHTGDAFVMTATSRTGSHGFNLYSFVIDPQ